MVVVVVVVVLVLVLVLVLVVVAVVAAAAAAVVANILTRTTTNGSRSGKVQCHTNTGCGNSCDDIFARLASTWKTHKTLHTSVICHVTNL